MKMFKDPDFMAKRKASSSVRYTKLSSDPSGEGFIDLQYAKPEPKIPWKGISLAVFLFVIGTSLMCLASLLLAGQLQIMNHEGAWPIMAMGLLMFIPGSYHVRIAYYAYKGYPGYHFEEIPDL